MEKTRPPPKIIRIYKGPFLSKCIVHCCPHQESWSPPDGGSSGFTWETPRNVSNVLKTLLQYLVIGFCQFWVTYFPPFTMRHGYNFWHVLKRRTLFGVKKYSEHFWISISCHENQQKAFKTQKNMFSASEIWRVLTIWAKKLITPRLSWIGKIS